MNARPVRLARTPFVLGVACVGVGLLLGGPLAWWGLARVGEIQSGGVAAAPVAHVTLAAGERRQVAGVADGPVPRCDVTPAAEPAPFNSTRFDASGHTWRTASAFTATHAGDHAVTCDAPALVVAPLTWPMLAAMTVGLLLVTLLPMLGAILLLAAVVVGLLQRVADAP